MKISLVCAFALFSLAHLSGQTVRMRTTLGDIDITMLPESAPKTVANFMNYMNKGAYTNSWIHRSVRGFIIQGGGYTYKDGAPVDIPQDAPVGNEYSLSNIRGTIAMAKLSTDPNSATNQWFFNLADNSNNLNNANNGYTVFGRIAGSAGLAVLDKIAALPVLTLSSVFDSLPVINYKAGNDVLDVNLIFLNSLTILGPAPAIDPNGIVTVSGFGGFPSATAGSFIEIYGSNLGGEVSRGWSDTDFKAGKAPTTLETISVTIGGQAAYVNFVSKNQVNVQVPTGVATGSVPVIVSRDGQQSAAMQLTYKALAPGLLAPVSFRVGSKQYVAALHANSSTFVSTAAITGFPDAPAAPGETLIFFGVGFGPVTGPTPTAGTVVTGQTALANALDFKIGGNKAQVSYAGLAPGLVGLYQFNVTVPANSAAGDLPVEVTVGTEPLSQTLLIPVK